MYKCASCLFFINKWCFYFFSEKSNRKPAHLQKLGGVKILSSPVLSRLSRWEMQIKKADFEVKSAFLRRERYYGPIFAVFLPFLYVLLTANNTHSR